MLKDEIQKKIYECKTDEDIKNFLEQRLTELEENTPEVTVGQGYTDSFNEFISKKVHYKPAYRFSRKECPDLVYDDTEPYISLIKELLKNPSYNELLLFSIISGEVSKYLPNAKDSGPERFNVYLAYIDEGKVSAQIFKGQTCAFCSEKSGLAHNMFKILGIDSSVICGKKNNEPHAYNIIYTNGYGNNPAVIFDASIHIDLKNSQGHSYNFGFFKVLSPEEYTRMLNGEPVTLDIAPSAEKYKQLYGSFLDGYELQNGPQTYKIGLGDTELEKKETELSSLEHDAKSISSEEKLINQQEQSE